MSGHTQTQQQMHSTEFVLVCEVQSEMDNRSRDVRCKWLVRNGFMRKCEPWSCCPCQPGATDTPSGAHRSGLTPSLRA
eukprot:352678-Chlamydomonas_euryale.AAC.4